MKEQLLTLITASQQGTARFDQVIKLIESHYHHQPTAFKNGDIYNQATQNQGSAKVFACAQLHNLSVADTVWLFAEHYQLVLNHPDATDHQNIRQFMAHGWAGIVFEGEVLSAK